jgi:uncharacterized protein with NAD-binding domain and iron-sulfur cluster
MTDAAPQKEKIAVLGGGLAALSAVFELTSQPGHQDRYDITVYQMGWRLGGKGASGRNAAYGERIEEHGLHILMGFYHNTFSVLRRCYAELGRAPGTPLATIEDAVKPHNYLVLADPTPEGWEPWPLRFQPVPGEPGVDAPEPTSVYAYLVKILAWAHDVFTDAPEVLDIAPDLSDAEGVIDTFLGFPRRSPGGERGWDPDAGDAPGPSKLDPRAVDPQRLTQLVDSLAEPSAGDAPGERGAGFDSVVSTAAYLYLAGILSQAAVANPGPRLVWLLREFRTWLGRAVEAAIGRNTALRRLWTLLDLGLTVVIGAVADGVVTAPDGWFSVDDLDVRAWLDKHGASAATRDGTLVRSQYNLAFTREGQLSAGAMIHAALRILFDYKGGIFQKMQAGMGDVIFGPLYEVLRRRGVEFAFFHRVDDLVVAPDGRSIAAIEMGRQARVAGGGAYDPMRDVGGLPCWPSEPRFEQLENGDALRDSGQNLESWWCTWPDAERITLRAGEDFDRVILGISIGAFPFVCKQLMAANDRFRKMVENVRTTQTQAVQLWFTGSLGDLGWKLESPVLDAFASPFDTWADMSHLLPREAWPEGAAPQNVAYLCSSMEDDVPPPDRDGGDWAAQQKARVRANAVTWMNESAAALWPAVRTRGRGGFDWSMLHDTSRSEGEGRLDAQYYQATFCPSERYVLAVPGSLRYRLRAEESGFANLVLAGDWIRTGMNIGCAEGAVMGGMMASRAISGKPEKIVGE